MGENPQDDTPAAQDAAVTLRRDANAWMRLLAADSKILSQRFDGDPAAGGRYTGSVTHPATTLEHVLEHYQCRGWALIEQPAAGA